MIDERFVFLALALNVYGSLSYVWAMFQGKAKPNRVTWGLWLFPVLITLFAQIDEGVGYQSMFTLSAVVGPTLVLTASFFIKDSYWKLKKRDFFLGGVSVISLILWQITGEGSVAIMFAILADFLAGLPTMIKSFNHPESESSTTYGLCVLASGITTLTINDWTFSEYSFSVYAFLFCAITFSFIQFKLGLKIMKRLNAK